MQQREGSTKYDLPLQRETVMALLIKALTKAQPSKQEKVRSYYRERRENC